MGDVASGIGGHLGESPPELACVGTPRGGLRGGPGGVPRGGPQGTPRRPPSGGVPGGPRGGPGGAIFPGFPKNANSGFRPREKAQVKLRPHHLSRLGELLNTLENVHPRGPPRLGGSPGPPGGPPWIGGSPGGPRRAPSSGSHLGGHPGFTPRHTRAPHPGARMMRWRSLSSHWNAIGYAGENAPLSMSFGSYITPPLRSIARGDRSATSVQCTPEPLIARASHAIDPLPQRFNDVSTLLSLSLHEHHLRVAMRGYVSRLCRSDWARRLRRDVSLKRMAFGVAWALRAGWRTASDTP